MAGIDFGKAGEMMAELTLQVMERKLAPVLARLAVLEARQADMAKALDLDARLRERIAVLEHRLAQARPSKEEDAA
jgi:hypothetical protein